METEQQTTAETAAEAAAAPTVIDEDKDKAKMQQTPNDAGRLQSLHDSEICLRLSDATYKQLPAHLINLFKHYDFATMSNAEILFLLSYLAAIEAGLGECSITKRCPRRTYALPSYFDAKTAMLLTEWKPPYKCDSTNTIYSMLLSSTVCNADIDDDNRADEFEKTDESYRIFKLTGIVTGDALILTLTPMQAAGKPLALHPLQSVYLSILRYVVGVPQTKVRPLQQHLINMKELANKLHQTLFLPAQQFYLPTIGIERFPSLIGLPSECYDGIFHCLNRNQLRILANVNKRLYNLIKLSKHYKR